MNASTDAAASAFVRYLTAKRAVDDRALNRHVLDAFRAHVPVGEPGRPLRVLEIGAGNATMACRMVEWDLLRCADYVAIDADPDGVADGRRTLPAWAAGRGLSCSDRGPSLHIAGDRVELALQLIHRDVLDFDPGPAAPFDLLVANAFLDMVDAQTLLPRLWSWMRPGGHFWFTINFDGETIFQPEVDPELDQLIMARYHRSMDERVVGGRRSGDSRTGRHLFGHLAGSGAELLAAGASDWVVHPIGGSYPGDEALFLHTIIDFVDGALRDAGELDRTRVSAWLDTRRRQIDQAALTYIAHQIDFFGRAGRPPDD
jgi:SAM-dependent methyltransferase